MWETLDIGAMLAYRSAQQETTVSGNVGSFTVPLGGVQRRGEPPISEPVRCSGNQWCTLDLPYMHEGFFPYYR